MQADGGVACNETVLMSKEVCCYVIVDSIKFNPHHLRGEERERKSKVTAIFARIEEYILFLCSVLSALCLFSVWCLSVSCFQSSVRCSLSINRAQVSSDRANCIPRVGGLRSPEASMLARVIAYGTWRREIMFMYLMWENSSLLSTKICSVLDVKSRLSHQHTLSQLELETAVLDSTHTMHKRLRQDEV